MVGSELRPARLLIADDDEAVREAVCELLGDLGYHVVGASARGEDAVEAAVDLRPDAVLMDVRMPGIGGLEATRRIRARLPEIPVVVMSAQDDDRSIERARDAGACAYVIKGTGIGTLRDAIADAVTGGVA